MSDACRGSGGDTDHARAVRAVMRALAAADYTIIAANTDEAGEPQVFAQSPTGELAFFLVRAAGREPDATELEHFKTLAERHGVAAYRVMLDTMEWARIDIE